MIRQLLIALQVALLMTGCNRQAEPARPVFTAMANSAGTSMQPTFAEREVVALELCPWDELRTGDTVIYWHDLTGQYIHHRIDSYDRNSGRWITRGDNNPGQDTGRMTSDEFIGRTHKLLVAPR